MPPIPAWPEVIVATESVTGGGASEHNLWWMLAVIAVAIIAWVGRSSIIRTKTKPENRPGGLESIYAGYDDVIEQLKKLNDKLTQQNIRQSEQIDQLTLKVDGQTEIIAEQESQLRRLTDHIEKMELRLSDAGVPIPAIINRR